MRLLLIRHGETVCNVEGRLQDADDPLTERGREQARMLAAAVSAERDIVAIYASPLVRAWETAQIIGEAVGIVPVRQDALAEINVGEAAGMRFVDWAEQFPAEAESIRTGSGNFAWPGGESSQEFGARVLGELERILQQHRWDAGAVLVVSHGGPLAWMIAGLLGEPLDRWPRNHMDLHNCSITDVLAHHDGATVLRRNDTAHLAP